MPTLAAPTALKATVISPTQVDLTWKDKSSGETGVTVYRKVLGEPNWTWIVDLPPDTTAYSDKAVDPDTSYSYRVEAFQAMPSSSVDAVTPSDGGGGGGGGGGGNGETLNSITEINDDMTLNHETKPHGVPSDWDWAEHGKISMGNDPQGWTAAIVWGHFYVAASGSNSSNTRMQVRNIMLYILSKATHQWNLIASTSGVDGAAYAEDFSDSIPISMRDEPDGGTSAMLVPGRNWHFWPTCGRMSIDPNDVGGVFSTFQAKLCVDNPALANDFADAHFVVNCGADYWPDLTASMEPNPGIGMGRFKNVEPDWRPINFATLSLAELEQYPPPLQ
jgi:hypothetical protein